MEIIWKIDHVSKRFHQAVAVVLKEPSLAIQCEYCEQLMNLVEEKMIISNKDQ